MVGQCRWLLVALVFIASGHASLWAASAESRAFTAASEMFRAGFYSNADAEFASFAEKYPESPHVPEAVLFQAEARVMISNYSGAISLLKAQESKAGGLADQYLFWQAEAHSRRGDLREAAGLFARLVRDFPASARRLDAGIGEADSLFKLKEWPRVVQLLEQTNGVFQAAARTNATNELVTRGRLLLGESRLAQRQSAEARAAVEQVGQTGLSPVLDWQRQNLLCRIALAEGKLDEALSGATNLLSISATTGRQDLRSGSVAFQAGVLERLGRIDEAVDAYTNNLAEGVPAERQRQALLKTAELSMVSNRLDEAARILGVYLVRYTNSPVADLALLTLGELRLRQFALEPNGAGAGDTGTNAPTTTNILELAESAFGRCLERYPQSPLVGKAQLGLGWCYWLKGNTAASETAFKNAVERLPVSPDLATALFKLGDAQFLQTNYAASAASYGEVLSRFEGLPEVKTNLFESAMYQVVRANLAAGNVSGATDALSRLLQAYPRGFHTGSGVLLTGEARSRQDPSAARKILSDYLRDAPDSSLAPMVRLAIARTYELQEQWGKAGEQYMLALDAGSNSPALAQAEYSRAWAVYRAGQETNAFILFTNLVSRYPTNDLTPLAQWWIADYYFRNNNPAEAEAEYQSIYLNTNLPPSELAYQARMMAGRVAVSRQGWEDAKSYFIWIANNTNCPTDLRAQALFAYGDYWIIRDSTNKLADYKEAINAFDAITTLCPSNSQTALAWGGKAGALLHWAEDANDFGPATNAFQQVLGSPFADASARSAAKVGLGIALEKMAREGNPDSSSLLEQALGEYLDVFYGKNLNEDDSPDVFWTRRAGMEAARLAGKLNQWPQAVQIYQRLRELVPALAPQLDKRISDARAQPSKPAD